jgi:hypothetical protein
MHQTGRFGARPSLLPRAQNRVMRGRLGDATPAILGWVNGMSEAAALDGGVAEWSTQAYQPDRRERQPDRRRELTQPGQPQPDRRRSG